MKARLACISLAAILVTVCAPVLRAQAAIHFDLPQQSLADAIRAVGVQTNTSVAFDPALVAGRQAPALRADLTVDQALTRLLQGTDIKPEFLNARTVVLAVEKQRTSEEKVSNAGDVTMATSAAAAPPVSADDPQTFWQRVAQADGGAAAGDTSASGSSQSSEKASLQEVVVTAQKKSERLQDVPVPVSVLNTESLEANNLTRLEDYFSTIPGVSFNSGFFGNSATIRGLSTQGNGGVALPTVGIVVDDIPFGSSQAFGFMSAPDLDPGDLAQIEVLRGPQGTLYGSSSIGGLIKYVTANPSTDSVSGRVEGGFDQVYNSAQPGYTMRASINIPLSDTLAIRVSGFSRRDPGFVDNVKTGQDAINVQDVYGGHFAAFWQVTPDVVLKLGALTQATKTYGSSDSQLTLPPLEQSFIAGTGLTNTTTQLYSANLTAKVGPGEFVSLTGYSIGHDERNYDLSGLDGLTTSLISGSTGTALVNVFGTRKFSQELRFSSPLSDTLDWLVGAFYTHEDNAHENYFYGVNATTGANLGSEWQNWDPRTLEEYAGFTDLTWKITDSFDVQGGVRYSQNRQMHEELITGSAAIDLIGVSSEFDPPTNSKDSSTTYLFTPRYKFSKDLMAYARLSSGYQVGGANNGCALLLTISAPCTYGPSKVQNYEIGSKGSFLDQRLSFDASVYYIDWKQIQVNIVDPTIEAGYFVNAGAAKSEGVELSIDVRPIQRFQLTAWATIDQSVLTSPFPAQSSAVGFAGDRLPQSSRFSANSSASYEIPLPHGLVGFAGGVFSWVGNRAQDFRPSPTESQPLFAGYARTDLHLGLKGQSWRVNAYVNNVADRRGILYYDPDGNGNVYIQPRTVGFTLVETF